MPKHPLFLGPRILDLRFCLFFLVCRFSGRLGVGGIHRLLARSFDRRLGRRGVGNFRYFGNRSGFFGYWSGFDHRCRFDHRSGFCHRSGLYRSSLRCGSSFSGQALGLALTATHFARIVRCATTSALRSGYRSDSRSGFHGSGFDSGDSRSFGNLGNRSL
jgi:hypothetical protein